MARAARESPARRLILWDVDGTLISAGPAARVAFDLAVAHVIGRAPGDHDVHMSGKTDPQIAMEILATMALSERETRDSLPGVLRSLELELERAIDVIRRDGFVHPGVEALLPRLADTPGVVQTVLTGNLAANARLKLGAFGLDRWFDLDIAATGDDHHDRTQLVPVALRKAEERFGHPFVRARPGSSATRRGISSAPGPAGLAVCWLRPGGSMSMRWPPWTPTPCFGPWPTPTR